MLRTRQRLSVVVASVVVIGAVVLGACSSSSKSSSPTTSAAKAASSTVTTAPARSGPAPSGPAATISGPITGGKGTPYLGSASTTDFASVGYTESEFFASGTARIYRANGTEANDGQWSATPTGGASYRTRIVVSRPSDSTRFNGTVLVEWLNVSGGIDAAPDLTYMSPELMRSGYAWVGVSVQQIGVSGGVGVVPVTGVPTGGLRGIDPARYGSLHHPGDAYALDIFSQVGRALRAPQQIDPLGGLHPQRVVAIGESQSAFELTTYIDAIQPVTNVYDGFFVHSRGGGAIPLAGGNIVTGIAGAVHIRDDLTVPVLMLETETDETFLGYFNARQPDTDRIRLWDVAGAAHADAYLVGSTATQLGCTTEINTSETHDVVAAALHALDQWLRTGTPPPPVPRMDVSAVGGRPTIHRDALGNALGGLRTPAVDAPVSALSGVAPTGANVVCSLFGSTTPFSAATLARLYPSRAAYITAFGRAADRAIAAGHILPADRAALLAEAAKVEL